MSSLSSGRAGLRPEFGRLLSQPTSSLFRASRWTASTDSHMTQNGSPRPRSPAWMAGSDTRSGSGMAVRSTSCGFGSAPVGETSRRSTR